MTTKSLKQQIEEEIEKLKPMGSYGIEMFECKKAQLELLDKIKEIIETKIESNEKRDISEVMKQNVKWELEELLTALMGEDK